MDQKRKASYNFDLINVYVADCVIQGRYGTGSPFYLGIYETPERAQEVFNQMHEFDESASNHDIFYMPAE